MRTENKVFYIDQPHKVSIKDIIKWCLYPFYNLFLKFVSLFFKEDKRETKYNISISSCFKNEGPFLKEFIEYHLFIGFEHFYLYNNNSTDNYLEVLQPYIDKGIVTLTDLEVVPVQVPSYKHFNEHFRNETKWVCFLDLDEFVCLKKDENVANWLDTFSKYPVVCIYWKYFGSSGLIDHDFSKTVIEQYTQATDKYINIGKCFYNTRYEIARYDVSLIHFLEVKWHGITIPAINEAKNFAAWRIQRIKNKHFTVQLNHYWSKAFNQYISKYKKGSGASGKMWKKIWLYKETEHLCKTTDTTILRFLTEIKLHLMGVDENKVLD
jgi:hypothetical protein